MCLLCVELPKLTILVQWQVELETKSRQGALDVLVYYGGTRKRDTEFIRKHDVILTTYATIEVTSLQSGPSKPYHLFRPCVYSSIVPFLFHHSKSNMKSRESLIIKDIATYLITIKVVTCCKLHNGYHLFCLV